MWFTFSLNTDWVNRIRPFVFELELELEHTRDFIMHKITGKANIDTDKLRDRDGNANVKQTSITSRQLLIHCDCELCMHTELLN